MTFTPEDVAELMARYMTADERAEFTKVYAADARDVIWRPLPGPQTLAYLSNADIVGYGGAAGGGKTDLGIGLGLTKHHKSFYARQHATELTGIYDRLGEILGSRDYRDMHGTWRIPGGPYGKRQFDFGSLANPGDEGKQQGKEKDLLVLEEAANMLEGPARFLAGWVRSSIGVPTQVLMTFNPPTRSEGRWVITFFGPWIDQRHINPADPGELRYFVGTKDNPDHEVSDNRPRVYVGGRLHTDFNPREFKREDILIAKSRTFIPARVADNPHLAGTNYMATLQALPEPLRSQMLYGDFTAGIKDSEWQVIPTAWVDAACERWKKRERKTIMQSVGVDVARGGDDNTIIARLHVDNWFDEPLVYPATSTPDGPTVAGLTIAALRDRAVVHIDVIGVGTSPYDFIKQAGPQIMGVNASEAAPGTDKTGTLTFANVRSWMWWSFREALDPNSNLAVALPPDKRLIQDLTTPRWAVRGKTIYVESREDLLKATRLGRSPDWGTAFVQAWIRTPKIADMRALGPQLPSGLAHDPYAHMADMNSGLKHDPYA